MKKQTWVIIVGIVIVFLIVMGVIALFPREDAGAQQSPSPTTARSTPTQELSDELPVVSADTQTKDFPPVPESNGESVGRRHVYENNVPIQLPVPSAETTGYH